MGRARRARVAAPESGRVGRAGIGARGPRRNRGARKMEMKKARKLIFRAFEGSQTPAATVTAAPFRA